MFGEVDVEIGGHVYGFIRGEPLLLASRDIHFTAKSLVSIISVYSWVPEGEEAEPDYAYRLFTKYNSPWAALSAYKDKIKVEGRVLLSRPGSGGVGEEEAFRMFLDEVLSSEELRRCSVVCQFVTVGGRSVRLCSFFKRRGKPIVLFTESPLILS